MNHSEIDKAYLAGFLDGEGSIVIDKHDNIRVPSIRVTVSNTYRPVLEELQQIWKGYISDKKPAREGWKPRSDLVWAARTAAEILQELEPYLRIKREQCQLALRFQETVNPTKNRTKSIPLEVQAYRLELRDKIRGLNHKGTRCNPFGEKRIE